MKTNSVRRLAVVLCLGLIPLTVSAQRDNLLSFGDAAVLSPPVAHFRTELERMQIPASPFTVLPTQYNLPETNIAIEAEDLRAALKKAGTAVSESDEIVSAFLAERMKLAKFDQALELAKMDGTWEADENGEYHKVPPSTAPEFPSFYFPPGLPDEFADYFEGILAWHNPNGDKTAARAAWERILNRPPNERRFRSTWAAFMLGRASEKAEPEKAIAYYEQIRALAKSGFTDSFGLAAASFGQEARVYLRQTNYERALQLYLEQTATGDNSGYTSLCFVMRKLLRGGETNSFPDLAKNPRTRQLVTSYLVSTKAFQLSSDYFETESNDVKQTVNCWLDLMQTNANALPASLREELALAAYQNGSWKAAQWWIDRTPSSPTARWLSAKLLLRNGHKAQAGRLLAELEPELPLDPPPRDTNAPVLLETTLTVPVAEYYSPDLDAAHQLRGELGVFHLASGNYLLSLDYFLRANLWSDAAYVAERVMTVDELKSYVDRYCPPQNLTNSEALFDGTLRGNLRHLLGRRLVRLSRGKEAAAYFPDSLRADLVALVQSLDGGWNESLPNEDRAREFFRAGHIIATNGMELLGTEVAPDWRLWDGRFESDFDATSRTGSEFSIFPATDDELRRSAEHGPDPNVRFHYRFQAALLGWQAAQLLPNNFDETARVLCMAGSWIKYLDPPTADIFYKSLVRRCRKTEIGDEADRMRWFPRLDDDGNLISRAPQETLMLSPEIEAPSEQAETTDEEAAQVSAHFPVPGSQYIIHRGDSLSQIAAAASVWGNVVSIKEIIEANPGLDPARLKIGQRILIPDTPPNGD